MSFVSVCFVANQFTTQFEIDILLENIKISGVETELLLYNNHFKGNLPPASRLLENTSTFMQSYSECINELLRNANSNYLCICFENSFYEPEWLFNILSFYQKVKFPGISSITDLVNDQENYILNNKEELIHITEYQTFNGLFFFSRSVLEKLGGFNEMFDANLLFSDYLLRTQKIGYSNLIVPKQFKIFYSEYFDPEKTNDWNNHQQFFPLFKFTIQHQELLTEIQNKLDKSAIFCKYRGHIILSKNKIENEDLSILYMLSKKHRISFQPSAINDLGIISAKLIVFVN